MKDKIYKFLQESGGTYYSFSVEKNLYYYDAYIKEGRTYIPMPTYREIAKAVGIKQSQVRGYIAQLEKEGKAVKPKWTWRRKIGTVLYRNEDGKEKTLTVYAGENCCFLLLDERSKLDYDIVEVFDSKDRFANSYDIWIIYGYGEKAYPGMINYKKLYGREDWLKWKVNINDTAWPGSVIAQNLKAPTYVVETYDEKI